MISVDHLTKHYGSFCALSEASLEIAEGELVGIIGKSGSGKSTLLNLLGGMDVPTSGSVVIGGTSIHELSASALSTWRGRNAGFVFQFFQLLPTLTAIENVMMPMDFCRTYVPRERRGRALELLERLGVGDQAGKLPRALSGGQQQRVAIARALANAPRVVLADEPTGNLDTSTATAIMDLLRSTADGGTTVIIATHDRDIARIADRVVEITDGVVAAQEPIALENAG